MTKTKIGGIVVATLLLLSVATLLPRHESEPPLPFNAASWKQEGGNDRLRMVDDLKPKLIGLSKTQVEELLGEPRRDVGELHPGYAYTYLLGTQQNFFDEDGIWLCIKFENDRVRNVEVLNGE